MEIQRLACLELRGGNQYDVYTAELPGLNGWVSCRPLRPAARGGDLYYLSVCSGGVISRVTLADVAGHGETVSSAAERLRDALRLHADSWDQSVLIRLLNDTFFRGDGLNGAGVIEYATAFVLSYYGHSGEVLFTNAGHLPPLWYRAATREWMLLEQSTPFSRDLADLPLGLISGTCYTQTAIQLNVGDLVLLYTDGVTESRDESGSQLGQKRLLAMARTLPVASPMDAGQALIMALERFRGHVPPEDDETIVALQRSSVQVN